NFSEEIYRLAERKKSKSQLTQKTTAQNRAEPASLSPSPFFLPPLNINKSPYRTPSLYGTPSLTAEPASPNSPISPNSSIITRVAMAANINSRSSLNLQGVNTNNQTLYTKRASGSLEGSNSLPSPNGDTITAMPTIKHSNTLKERINERRMTLKGWSLNRNRSTTQ
ncbi:4327_t:CDS:1, partial [Acaulospora morrowiae]